MENNILKMTHGSLFSGIGGFDLAAEWAGWENIFHCEWNEFGQKVLKHHFPKSISYNDITKTDFSIHRGTIDIITGGFPCQPYSTAGKRLGKNDERHLFPEMLRCIKEVKPRWIVGENVRGLVSWNEGLVFHEVYDDLEREGYEVQSFLIPAAGVDAPHQRYRVWFVAYSHDSRTDQSMRNNREWKKNDQGQDRKSLFEFGQNSRDVTDSDSGRLEGSIKEGWNGEYVKWENGIITQKSNVTNSSSIGLCGNSEGKRLFVETSGAQLWMGEENVADPSSIRLEQCSNEGEVRRETTDAEVQRGQSPFATETISGKHKPNWNNFPTKSPICGGDDGIPRKLDSITFSKWRNESIKAYGNAIVPQVAYQIFNAINEFEKLQNGK